MTDDGHAEELADRALHRLRDTITTGVVPPPAASLRTHANRWLRARRATAGGLAAAAVAALALGGTVVWQPTAAPPGPAEPAGSSPPPPADTSIKQVDWATATVNLPPGYGCPPGPVALTLQEEGIPHRPDGWEWATGIPPYDAYLPAVALWLDPAQVGNHLTGEPSYGDLTGDGEPEAVLRAICFESADLPGGIADDGLLVVTREPDGTLTGLGWVDPPEDVREPYWTSFRSFWVAGGRLFAEAAELSDPGTPRPDFDFAHPPGEALAYRWDGKRLTADGPAAEYPPLLSTDGAAGPPVRLGPVADGLGCPDAELRFTPDPTIAVPGLPELDFRGGMAQAGGEIYRFRPNDYRQHLFDLDGSGARRLLVTIKCQPTGGGARTEGLAVFEPAGTGWRGVSVLPSPTEPGHHYLISWRPDGQDVVLSWSYDPACGECDIESVTDRRYRWTGSELVPVNE